MVKNSPKSILNDKRLLRHKFSIDNFGTKIGIIMLSSAFIAIIIGIILVNYIIMPYIIGYGNEIKVPDITGMYIVKATKELRNKGLSIKIIGEKYSNKIKEGIVISQTPLPNSKIKFNKTIEVSISKGAEKTIIPYVNDLYINDAIELLKQTGFSVSDTVYTFSDEINENNAINTDPPADVLIPKGSKIKLYVSKGKKSDYVKLPSFIGLTPDSAKGLARSLKIVIGEINEQYGEIDRPTIIMQSPDSGVYILKNDTIKLVLQIPSWNENKNEKH